MSSRFSTSSVPRSSHHDGVGLVEQPGHHRHPAVATARPDVLDHLVVEGLLEQRAPDHVEVLRGGAVGGLLEVPAAQLALAGRPVAARQVDRQQARHQRCRERAARVELDPRHVLDREPAAVAGGLLDQVADPLGAVALVPVGGEEVGVVRPDHGLVGGDHEALVGVEHVGQPVERHVVAGPVVLAEPPGLRLPPVVPGLADRHQAGRLVADVAVAVGVHDVLGGYGERGHRLAEAGPVGRDVEVEDRVGGRGRRERRPGQRDGGLDAAAGVPSSGRADAGGVVGGVAGEVGVEVGDVAEDRPVRGRAHRDGDVVLAAHLDGLVRTA